MKGLKERLLYFIEYKGLPVQMFEKIVGLSNAAVSKMGDNTRRSTIDKISKSFPELDVNWLLTGQGEMLSYGQDAESISNKVQEPTSHYGRKELMKEMVSPHIYFLCQPWEERSLVLQLQAQCYRTAKP